MTSLSFGQQWKGPTTAQPQASGPNPNHDAEVPGCPSDGISSIHFGPAALGSNFLLATSWDNTVRCWQIEQNGNSVPKAQQQSTAPLLCSSWSHDGQSIFFGGIDKQVKMWNLATNQVQQVAQHDQPIRHVQYLEGMNVIVTGSWDKTIKYWDLRQNNPACTYTLKDKCYALHSVHPLLVVGTADRQIYMFNLQNPQSPYKTQESPLKWQTRCLACYPDATGFLIGSIEGRVAVHHVDDKLKDKNFTFKCHRENNTQVYAVNAINFHNKYGTFATAGSDGSFCFWDKDSKQRLKTFTRVNQPISAASFSADCNIYAYAVSYDWSRGHAEYQAGTAKNYILMHSLQGEHDAEIRKRERPRK